MVRWDATARGELAFSIEEGGANEGDP